jgi:MFS family permease
MLLPLMLLAVIAYLLMGPMQVLLPTIAEQTLKLSPTSQGRYLSLIALGLIVGGILAMLVKDKGKIGVNTMMALLMSGACLGMLGDITSLKTSITILLIAGICGGIAVSFIVASIQHFSHDEYRGRIMSVYTIVGQFIPALSGVLAGVLADVFSPKTALSIMAFIIAVAVLSCLALSKNLRQFHGFSHA